SLLLAILILFTFFFSSRRRHTRFSRDWSSDVCSSDLHIIGWVSGPSDRVRSFRYCEAHAHPPHLGLASGPAPPRRRSDADPPGVDRKSVVRERGEIAEGVGD